MENSEENNLIDGYHDTIAKVRGTVIHKCIALEMYIDAYITEYFCGIDGDKGTELSTLLLAPRVTWSNKFEVFTVLIKLHNPNFIKENTVMFSDKGIKNIIEKRNIFAHYPSDHTLKAISDFQFHGLIKFLKFKNATEKESKKVGLVTVFPFSEIDINQLLTSIQTYAEKIRTLLKLD